jgi:hypothetical protein
LQCTHLLHAKEFTATITDSIGNPKLSAGTIVAHVRGIAASVLFCLIFSTKMMFSTVAVISSLFISVFGVCITMLENYYLMMK